MCDSARLYNCARCQCQAIICRRCDRGNHYCSPECAGQSRQEKQREAALRYQRSLKGRHRHAQRQQRYRQRQKEKVTHQCSVQLGAYDLLTTVHKTLVCELKKPLVDKKAGIVCHFCGCHCDDKLRWTFLYRQSTRLPTFSLPSITT
jgi:hypothetical protein